MFSFKEIWDLHIFFSSLWKKHIYIYIYQFLLKFVEASNLTVPVFLVHPNLPIPNLCGLLSVNMHCLAPANVSRLIAESTFLLMIVVLNPSLRGSKVYFFLSFQGTFSSMGNIHGTRNMTFFNMAGLPSPKSPFQKKPGRILYSEDGSMY
jgi:hypothetical protein